MLHAVQRCPLFAGLKEEETRRALDYFGAYSRRYQKGDTLHQILSPMEHFALVLSGSVSVQMDDLDGYKMILANVQAGGIFGESLCFLGQEAPVYIVATTDCEVLWMDVKKLKAPGQKDAFQTDMANRFTAIIAQRALNFNDRIQILSKPTLRSKLITFLSQYMGRRGDCFTIPFDRESLASYLGVNRSALSRELGAMAREGIISFHKNQFTVHHNIVH